MRRAFKIKDNISIRTIEYKLVMNEFQLEIRFLTIKGVVILEQPANRSETRENVGL